MAFEAIKVCSHCGAEYDASAEVCADCGAKLVYRTDERGDIAPLDEGQAEVLVREGGVDYLREMARELATHGIRCAILLHAPGDAASGTGAQYGLYVEKDCAAEAREVDRKHWLRGAPEEAATFEYKEQELAGVCPACSTPIPEGCTECPECGLVVNPEADMATCPECDAVVGDEVSRCPSCGVEFE